MKIVLLIIFGLSLFTTWKNIERIHRHDLREAEKVVNSHYTWYDKPSLSLITDRPVAQLRKLHTINPKKFQIESYGVIYNSKILFSFSSIQEWFKFLLWRKELREQEEDQAKRDKKSNDDKLLKEMYEDLLSDLEKQKQEAQEMMREGANGIAEVLDRISGDEV